jgi:hypothetical protein
MRARLNRFSRFTIRHRQCFLAIRLAFRAQAQLSSEGVGI